MDPRVFFPIWLIILDVCAAIVYGYYRDWWFTGYWLSAGAISLCTLFMKRC